MAGQRVEVVEDLYNRFEKIYETLQDRQRTKAETVKELEQRALRHLQKVEENWKGEIEELQQQIAQKQVALSSEKTKKSLLEKELENSWVQLREIEIVIAEHQAETIKLQDQLKKEQTQAAQAKDVCHATKNRISEVEAELSMKQKELESAKVELENIEMTHSELLAKVDAAHQQAIKKKASQKQRESDLHEQELMLKSREDRLRQEMETAWQARMKEIQKTAYASRQSHLEAVKKSIETLYVSDLESQRTTYSQLEAELEEVCKGDLTSQLAHARNQKLDAQAKVASIEALKDKLKRLQQARTAEVASRGKLREQQANELQQYRDLLAIEGARAHRTEEHNRLLDSEISRLKDLVEAGEKMLGLQSTSEKDSTYSGFLVDGKQAGADRKRRRTAQPKDWTGHFSFSTTKESALDGPPDSEDDLVAEEMYTSSPNAKHSAGKLLRPHHLTNYSSSDTQVEKPRFLEMITSAVRRVI